MPMIAGVHFKRTLVRTLWLTRGPGETNPAGARLASGPAHRGQHHQATGAAAYGAGHRYLSGRERGHLN